jgi:hypothetical protein
MTKGERVMGRMAVALRIAAVVLAVAAPMSTGCRKQSACDAYYERYAACIAKMGPAARAAAAASLERERERLRAAEHDDASREQAAAACQASLRAIESTCR